LKREKVDRYSRTTYDRVPDPPPHGPKGADKITILEDTDGDGRPDRAKDFIDGLNLTSGFAFGHGGLFVLQVPYLLFYADRDRDDVPDGDPEVLLSGFGMEDAHSVANSLTWGPDGWLYGCQGSTVTANIRGIEFQQGVWRYHPVSRRFELFCEGGGNAWGLDFDAHGNLFYATNYGGYAMVHGVQGGYYWKQFGKHGALHNPYTYGYFDHVPHEKLRGGHVTVGGLVYQEELFPSEFRGKYIGADLLGHAVYWHELRGKGSTFAARQTGDLLLANDTWFAPSDMTVGPDGAIYVCDWHDQRMAHPDPDAEWDRTNGRIYRIQPERSRAASPAFLAGMSAKDAVAHCASSSEWYARRARRVIAEQQDPAAREKLRESWRQAEKRSLPLLWSLYLAGGFDEVAQAQALQSDNADVRAWTARLIGDENQAPAGLGSALAEVAAKEQSVTVRCQLACTARRLPPAQALPIVRALLAHSEDTSDPYMPLLLWWAVEQHVAAARDEIVALVSAADVWRLPLVHDVILPRLMRRNAAEASDDGYLACAALLRAAPQNDRPLLLAALDRGLMDRGASRGGNAGTLFATQAAQAAEVGTAAATQETSAKIPQALLTEIARDWRDDTHDINLIRLQARMGSEAASKRALALATDRRLAAPERIEAIRVLGEVERPDSVDLLLSLLSNDEPREVQRAALESLATSEDPRIGSTLLQHYAHADPADRSHLVGMLLGRKAWAREFLAAIDQGDFPKEQVAVDQLRVVALHEDAQLDALVKKHWGRVQSGTPEERLAEMRRINNDLRAGAGDLHAGKLLFARHCGTCHRLFGEGNQIGPELTHANRKNTDELLATIVDPSAVVRREYLSFVAQTNEGRVLTGLLVDQTLGSVTLLDAKNQRTVVPRDRLETLVESPTSLMPENLLSALAPQELRDLFAYLQSEVEEEKRLATEGTEDTE
jgi:putative membrane-bound dehydrogenase-like protein